ncbi:MAG TPA: type II toxin-antitoxin system RelE/ParE family toxin [Thermoanaerobaculia bacterium]|nr:type II toxin-antitoxin system RelE/ParE family toxin [Thermoanaerobaculia bacterium]
MRFGQDPFPRGAVRKGLTQPALGTCRYRVGDYRVIFDIAGSDLVILRAGHRSSIYR